MGAHIILVSCDPLGNDAACRAENTGLDRRGYNRGRHAAGFMSSWAFSEKEKMRKDSGGGGEEDIETRV